MAGLTEGIDLFNDGRYWEAHEAWELDWMPDRKGPDSGFYKGLIQIAAGCLHYTGAAQSTNGVAGLTTFVRIYQPIEGSSWPHSSTRSTAI